MNARPINSLWLSAAVTAALMIAGGWLAASVTPVSVGATGSMTGRVEAPLHAGLRIDLRGVRSDRGNIVVMVYDDADALASYSSESYAAYQSHPAHAGAMTFDFDELGAGPYAITAHHDENANWAYDDEGWATSGQRGAYDEPPFERAAVAPGLVTMTLFYYD